MNTYLFTIEIETTGELKAVREYAYNLIGAIQKVLEFYGCKEREIKSILIEQN
jgi:hypothetical protein